MHVNPNDFGIDQSNLDNELCSLGSKMYEYGEAEGILRVAVESAKADLEFTEAVLDTDIRMKAKESGTKTTEAQVKNEIILRQEYKESITKLLFSQDEYNRIKAALVSMIAKKDCLIALSYRDRDMMRVGKF
jgi:hypothetical protein